MIISKIKILSPHPLEALLQLDRARKDALDEADRVDVVVMPADLRLDTTLKAPDGEALEFDHPDDQDLIDALAYERLEERREPLRVIGPASAGLATGPGDIALVTAIGAAFGPLVQRLGDALSVAIDLGLGWDVSAGELLARLATQSSATRFALVLPYTPSGAPEETPCTLWVGLAQGLAALAGRPLFAVARASQRDALETHGALVVPDLDALVDALCSPVIASGPRVALVSSLDGGARFFEAALLDAGLQLATPSEQTLAALRTELPRFTRFGGHLQIPKPTARHVALAREHLTADPGVDALWVTVGDAMDPFQRASLLAVRARSSDRSNTLQPLVEPAAENPRTHAHLMALRLMKRNTLSRDDVTALLGRDVVTAPALAATSLGAARAAAKTLGFPVRLAPGDAAALVDDAALVTAWESLVSSLASRPSGDPADAPRARHEPDPWQTRLVLPGGPTTRLTYRREPLPTLHGPNLALPLPGRERDLTHLPNSRALIAALSSIAVHHPEVDELVLELDADGRLIDGSGALVPLPLPT